MPEEGADDVLFWKFWLEGILLPTVGTFGVAGILWNYEVTITDTQTQNQTHAQIHTHVHAHAHMYAHTHAQSHAHM